MIAILTLEQKNQILGLTYDGISYFNPIKDINNNWVISEEEINKSSLEWLKSLPLVNFDAPITENHFI